MAYLLACSVCKWPPCPQPRSPDPRCGGGRETDARGSSAGHTACPFPTPRALCFRSGFLQMKQLHVLSQLTLKTKTLLSFLNTYEKKRLFFNFQKRQMNSFGVQIQPSRISLKLSPWVLVCNWDQASFGVFFCFFVLGFFFFLLFFSIWKDLFLSKTKKTSLEGNE